MKKIAMVILMVLIVTMFTACATTSTETNAENNTSASTATTSENIIENTYVTGYSIENIPFATAQEEEAEEDSGFSEDEIREIVDDLGVWFDTTAPTVDYSKDSTTVKSYYEDIHISALFIKNELMSNHELEFSGTGIERFVPKTFPDGESIDGTGAVHESDLETGVAIHWEYGTQLAIVVDGIYTIYII